MATTAKTQSTQRRTRKRAKGFKLPSDVRAVVRKVDGFIEINVEISPERIDMLVSAGAIPAANLEKLKFHAQQLIADLLDFQREMSVQPTHRQLLGELIRLRGMAKGGVVPIIPPSLRSEILRLAVRVRLSLPYSSPPTIPLEDVDEWRRAMDDAKVEAADKLLDAPALQNLLEEVIKFVDRSGATTPQHFAAKGAFRIEDEVIYGWIENFWHCVLGRRLVTSPELTDFAIAVFKLCGVPIPNTLERKLQYLIRNAAGRAS
jgi:hypothetical protein